MAVVGRHRTCTGEIQTEGQHMATVIAGVTLEDLRVFADAWNRHDVDALKRAPDYERFWEARDRA